MAGEPLDWTGEAACVGTDPAIWFPVIADGRPFPSEVMERARPYCTDCPVLVACHDWAVHHEADGIWANTDPYGRRRLRKALGIVDPDLTREEHP